MDCVNNLVSPLTRLKGILMRFYTTIFTLLIAFGPDSLGDADARRCCRGRGGDTQRRHIFPRRQARVTNQGECSTCDVPAMPYRNPD